MENNKISKAVNSNDILSVEEKLEKSILTLSDISNTIDNEQYTYLVYCTNNIKAGYICYADCVDHIDLISIAVIPEYRQCHIASMLLEYMIKNTSKDIFLEVRISNQPAIKFYEKFNFKRINIRKKYYSLPTEDAAIYIKPTTN